MRRARYRLRRPPLQARACLPNKCSRRGARQCSFEQQSHLRLETAVRHAAEVEKGAGVAVERHSRENASMHPRWRAALGTIRRQLDMPISLPASAPQPLTSATTPIPTPFGRP